MVNHRIADKIEKAILQGIFPGAAILCSVNGEIMVHESYGLADIFEQRPVEKKSVFDLASLTKPLATTLAVSKLIEKDQMFLDQKIGTIIEEASSSPMADITIDMLLRHTSGLPAHRNYYQKIISGKKNPRHLLRELLVKEKLVNKIGKVQLYSDLGFMFLSWIIERLSGQRLDQFVLEQVYSPLDIDGLFFMETNQKKERGDFMSQKPVATQKCPWRKKLLVGEVEDDNAWAAGGIEGHAGLFGDTGSIHTLCCELLNALQNKTCKVLVPDIIHQLVNKKNHHEMVAGFDTPAKVNSSAGHYFSNASIGHLGFTGTSFWIDPKISLIVIFLTNRVHPSRSNEGIKEFRPKLHDLIISELT